MPIVALVTRTGTCLLPFLGRCGRGQPPAVSLVGNRSEGRGPHAPSPRTLVQLASPLPPTEEISLDVRRSCTVAAWGGSFCQPPPSPPLSTVWALIDGVPTQSGTRRPTDQPPSGVHRLSKSHLTHTKDILTAAPDHDTQTTTLGRPPATTTSRRGGCGAPLPPPPLPPMPSPAPPPHTQATHKLHSHTTTTCRQKKSQIFHSRVAEGLGVEPCAHIRQARVHRGCHNRPRWRPTSAAVDRTRPGGRSRRRACWFGDPWNPRQNPASMAATGPGPPPTPTPPPPQPTNHPPSASFHFPRLAHVRHAPTPRPPPLSPSPPRTTSDRIQRPPPAGRPGLWGSPPPRQAPRPPVWLYPAHPFCLSLF